MSALAVTAAAALLEPSPWPLNAVFVYDTERPLEVAMTLALQADFEYMGEPLKRSITWVFARELLDAALTNPDVAWGFGDVEVELFDNTLRFRLADDKGARHVVLVEAEPAVTFMIRSFMLISQADAKINERDVDEAIAQILEAAS